MVNSRLTLLLALPLVASCGLLSREQALPDEESIRLARAEDSQQWSLLAEALERMDGDPQQGLQGVRAMVAEHPEDVRLALFLQDMELRTEDPSLVLLRADTAFRERPTALNALLAARVQEEPSARYRLLGMAVSLDPGLIQAQAHRIWMEARAGKPEVLDRLISLLHEDPGSAETWRLLADLAPLYGRLDLARAAAHTEPWSSAETSSRAAYTLAVADLKAGNARAALDQARRLPPELWEGRLLEAAALAVLDNPQKALEVVEAVLEKHPEEPAALFNRALLLRDYLGRSDEARVVLQRFLEVSAASGQANLMRVMQAQLWLSLDHGP